MDGREMMQAQDAGPAVCGPVVRIDRLAGERVLVVLEDGTGFPLYRKELDQFAIREGEELEPGASARIFGELLPKRARACAMNYLLHMDRTEQQLRRKLQELGYPRQAAEQAVEYVRSFHYLDDVRYAVNYMTGHSEDRSLHRMEQELYQRGISRESFEKALLQVETPDEEQQIRKLLEKKHYSGAEADRKETERITRFLLGRGYRMSAIQHVLLDIEPKTV